MDKEKVNQPPKIAITREAEDVLSAAYTKLNDGFQGGKISKLEVASFALIDNLEKLTEAKIEKIRKQYFNEICYFESIIEENRRNGTNKFTPEQLATIQNLVLGKNDKSRKAKEEPQATLSIE
jgi:hypothetical protein